MLLGEPLRLGALTLRNRIVGAPMERNYCDETGRVTPVYVDYVANRALGGAALVFTEATYVRQDGKSRLRQMGLTTDEHEAGLREMADRVHAAGGLLGIELNHGGRTSQSAASGEWPVAPSPIPLTKPGSDVPHELTREGIADIVRCFEDSARRAVRAGVDVIMIHAAHGYLIQAFMSPATNHRTDEYADPTRFVSEVTEAVRRGAGNAPVGIRLSAFEGSPGGLSAQAQLEIFERVGPHRFDFVDVSAGNYEAPQWSVQPAEFGRGLLAEFARPYRRFGLPVGVAGRICDGDTAERILRDGDADFISMARALHADARFPVSVLGNRPYRPCIACNLCADELGSGAPVRCSMNAEVGMPGGEREGLEDAACPARVLVVGAGPAGAEAACLLGEAGHAVTLIDEHDGVGGQFRLPANLRHVPEYHRLQSYYQRRLEDAGVSLRLSESVTATSLADEEADLVLLATGSRGRALPLDGTGAGAAQDIRAWLATSPGVPAELTILGGDREAVAVGYHLANKGTRVTIIADTDDIGEDMGTRAKILARPYLLAAEHVDVHLGCRVLEVEPDVVRFEDATGVREHAFSGPLVTTNGAELRRELVDLVLDDPRVLHVQAAGPNETVVEAVSCGRVAAREAAARLAAATAQQA